MNSNYYLLVIVVILTGFLLIPLPPFHYSSDGDLRGTQTKYLENKSISVNQSQLTTQLNEITQMANPASVYCEDQGGILNLTTGMCAKNGKLCEEWAYYRGECGYD